MPILSVKDVFSGYGETEVLHGVTMHIEPEEIVTVIGPNGAGKSTLIKTVIGILKPTSGQVVFDGMDITGFAPERLALHGVAYVPQLDNIFPTLSVYENLEMGAIVRRPSTLTQISRKIQRMSRVETYAPEEFEERVEWILSIFPTLRPKVRDKARMLSGGEQQMVALAKTLVLDPDLLLIDEPSAGLAPNLVQSIFEKIVDINAQETAIVLVEQNARRALELADRGYVLDMGRNRFEGEGKALLADPDVGRLYLGG